VQANCLILQDLGWVQGMKKKMRREDQGEDQFIKTQNMIGDVQK